jgi:hypothetical protein
MMKNGLRFRSIGLAVVVMAGVFHLSTAEAAVPARMDSCDDYAAGYVDGYCDAQGKDWSSVSYRCNANGTVTILAVSCAS